MTPRDPIDTRAVLDKVDLADLVRKRGVVLKERSGKLSGCCPFHQETTPSFFVFRHPRPGHFHCFGCGAHGDAIGFVRQLDRIGFLDAIEQLGGPQQLTEADRQRIRRQEAEAERRRVLSRIAKLANAAEIWAGAQPADGTPVEAYLRARCVDLDAIGHIPGVIRFGTVPYYWEDDRVDPRAPREERFKVLATPPAMVAMVQGADGAHIASHVTWLRQTPDGTWDKVELADPITGKIMPKKKIIGPYGGGAIRLTPLGPTLRAGEGIETSLTVLGALRRASRGDAVWALGSLGNLAGRGLGHGPRKPGTREVVNGRVRWQRRPSPIPDPQHPSFVPPPGVSRFVWLGDSDGKDPEAGRLLVERGLARYRALGIDAAAVWAAPGMDFNDMARGRPA